MLLISYLMVFFFCIRDHHGERMLFLGIQSEKMGLRWYTTSDSFLDVKFLPWLMNRGKYIIMGNSLIVEQKKNTVNDRT